MCMEEIRNQQNIEIEVDPTEESLSEQRRIRREKAAVGRKKSLCR